MSVEVLRSILNNTAASTSERQAASERLRALGGSSPNMPDVQTTLGDAGQRAEEFLRTIPLDAIAKRFLEFAGRETFHSVIPQDIDRFARSEEGVSRKDIERLHALSMAAGQVHASYVDPDTEPNLCEIFSILEMLGVSVDEAQARYRAIAGGVE